MSGDLIAILKRVWASEGKPEIDNSLRNCVNSGFGFEAAIVNEATNKTIEHVGRDTIEVKKFSDNFKLDVKVFIAGTEFKNSM